MPAVKLAVVRKKVNGCRISSSREQWFKQFLNYKG